MTDFWVPGIPQGQGRISTINGHSFHSNAKELKPWRQAVGWAAKAAGTRVSLEPIKLELRFVIGRPKTVTRSLPTVAPDLDHLIRAIFDSLTGIAYRDDSQVVVVTASKAYGDTPGVGITITPLLSL